MQHFQIIDAESCRHRYYLHIVINHRNRHNHHHTDWKQNPRWACIRRRLESEESLLNQEWANY